ncbi:MAG: integrase arm-type DNA-binding domain-containing protein, partial [Gallionellaceae bacterium]
MALSDAKVKAATVPEGKKQDKLADGGGLYLLVKPKGKYWRFDYRFADKRKTLAIGVYPSVSLKEARNKREAARKLLEKNIDPNQSKQAEKRKAEDQARASTFEGVAREWLANKSPAWAEATHARNRTRLEKHIFPWVGSLPIRDIEPIDILSLVRRIESKGYNEMAHRVKRLCGQVFRYGVACQYVKGDPTRDLADALAPVVTKHHACLTESKAVGALMRAIQGYQGTHTVACALQLSPYVFLRPKELRTLEWSFIDFEKKEISIPADK